MTMESHPVSEVLPVHSSQKPANFGLPGGMDAILERKWDLADLLMRDGADARATDDGGQNIMG